MDTFGGGQILIAIIIFDFAKGHVEWAVGICAAIVLICVPCFLRLWGSQRSHACSFAARWINCWSYQNSAEKKTLLQHVWAGCSLMEEFWAATQLVNVGDRFFDQVLVKLCPQVNNPFTLLLQPSPLGREDYLYYIKLSDVLHTWDSWVPLADSWHCCSSHVWAAQPMSASKRWKSSQLQLAPEALGDAMPLEKVQTLVQKTWGQRQALSPKQISSFLGQLSKLGRPRAAWKVARSCAVAGLSILRWHPKSFLGPGCCHLQGLTKTPSWASGYPRLWEVKGALTEAWELGYPGLSRDAKGVSSKIFSITAKWAFNQCVVMSCTISSN